MAAFKKFFKDFKNEHVLGIVGLVFLVYALYQYSQNKSVFQLGMTPTMDLTSKPAPSNGTPNKPAQVTGASSSNTYAPFNGASQNVSNSVTTSNQMNKPTANPGDLLPGQGNLWGGTNPSDLTNVNLLNPTQVVGINTQGSSLRNANLQLRSEPPNPRTNTNCPWNISTIEDDKFRKQLEIGSSA